MAKKPKNIMFKTRKQSTDGEFKKFSVIFACGVLAILLISCLAILSKHDFNVRSAMGGDSLTTSETVQAETTLPQISGEKTYFFRCKSDDGSDLRFAWLMNVRMPEAAVSVCALKPDMKIAEDGKTLESALLQLGDIKTVDMLEEFLDITIDGYIGSDDESFKAIINYFGGIDVTVPEQIEYRGSEFTVILVKGRQNLKGDSLFKYLRYLETLGERGRNLQSTVLLDAVDMIFRPENINRSERYFSKLSNVLDTDLSIVDFSTARAGIDSLMQSGIKDRNIADTVEEFAE